MVGKRVCVGCGEKGKWLLCTHGDPMCKRCMRERFHLDCDWIAMKHDSHANVHDANPCIIKEENWQEDC